MGEGMLKRRGGVCFQATEVSNVQSIANCQELPPEFSQLRLQTHLNPLPAIHSGLPLFLQTSAFASPMRWIEQKKEGDRITFSSLLATDSSRTLMSNRKELRCTEVPPIAGGSNGAAIG